MAQSVSFRGSTVCCLGDMAGVKVSKNERKKRKTHQKSKQKDGRIRMSR